MLILKWQLLPESKIRNQLAGNLRALAGRTAQNVPDGALERRCATLECLTASATQHAEPVFPRFETLLTQTKAPAVPGEGQDTVWRHEPDDLTEEQTSCVIQPDSLCS